jgi:periplasmic divalent cation tolerance protein
VSAPDAIVVLCSAPLQGNGGRLGAHDLARALVDEHLCACVSVVPAVRSFFRWEGRVESAEELLLVAKTTPAAVARLRARIVALHPYQVPEVIELPVAGALPKYLEWLVAAVRPDAR